MWIKNFFKELKAWRIVKQVYKQNKTDFEKHGIHCDWFGKLYIVINRDTDIILGSDEDKVYLQNDFARISQVLVNYNIMDILAFKCEPLEHERRLKDGRIEYEHAYLITFTPAYNLDHQYVNFWSILGLTLLVAGIIGGIIYLLVHFL